MMVWMPWRVVTGLVVNADNDALPTGWNRSLRISEALFRLDSVSAFT